MVWHSIIMDSNHRSRILLPSIIHNKVITIPIIQVSNPVHKDITILITQVLNRAIRAISQDLKAPHQR
jgi:hypothetical protein